MEKTMIYWKKVIKTTLQVKNKLNFFETLKNTEVIGTEELI